VKPRAFAYQRAHTVDEARHAYAAAGGDGVYIAGGQSLLPALALRLQAPATLIDIAPIEALRGIALEGDTLRIGALTRHAEMLVHPLIAAQAPLYAEAAPFVAHPAIRNRGTLGGTLALADPAAEFPAVTLALDAEIEIAGEAETRRVPAREFFLDLYTTALEPGELVRAVHVPPRRPGAFCAFDEIVRRRGDYALVGCAIDGVMSGGMITQIRIAFCSVGPTPMSARTAETLLAGTIPDAQGIEAAVAALAEDLDPPGDPQVSAEMRLHLAGVLLKRLLQGIASLSIESRT
jgi:aerobic carbon-monoxide dehydrogenase medium subunit